MENLKRQLKRDVLGKVQVRKEKYGATIRYKVMFDNPTPDNKAIIKTLINLNGYKVLNEQVIVTQGVYGYNFYFQ